MIDLIQDVTILFLVVSIALNTWTLRRFIPLIHRVTNLELWVHRHAPFIDTSPVPAPPLTHGIGGDRHSWEDI